MLRRLLKPDRGRNAPPQRPAKLIVGLGNPGAKYQNTRHNVGFMVIDKLSSETEGSSRERFQGAILETRRDDETMVLLKPLTFMNNSGASVSQVANWYKIPPEQILVVYDDLDLPYGTIRLRPKGSAGGHNGLESVIRHVGTDELPRLRIGIGRPISGSTVNYVLSRFTRNEQTELADVIDSAAEVAECWVSEGVQVAMNRYNRAISSQAEKDATESASRAT